MISILKRGSTYTGTGSSRSTVILFVMYQVSMYVYRTRSIYYVQSKDSSGIQEKGLKRSLKNLGPVLFSNLTYKYIFLYR